MLYFRNTILDAQSARLRHLFQSFSNGIAFHLPRDRGRYLSLCVFEHPVSGVVHEPRARDGRVKPPVAPVPGALQAPCELPVKAHLNNKVYSGFGNLGMSTHSGGGTSLVTS